MSGASVIITKMIYLDGTDVVTWSFETKHKLTFPRQIFQVDNINLRRIVTTALNRRPILHILTRVDITKWIELTIFNF